MYQVCRALSAAHDKGIVHRDLKPDNVFLLAREGRPDFVKVLDFGLARVTNLEPGQRLTKSGAVLGTPEYMAPEQVLGEPVDARADVYSAGCMLYELVTAQIPFVGGNYMLVLQKHLQTPPEPPSKIMPGISAALDSVVLKAMAKAPPRRFQSMKDLALAICAAQGDDPRQAWGVDEAPVKETPTVQSALVSWAESKRLTGRTWPLWAGIVAASAIAGAMLWWAHPPAAARGPSMTATAALSPTVTAAPAVVAAPSAAPTSSATRGAHSHVSIVSEPAGAEVTSHGALLGRTPLALDLPPASAPFEVTLSHHGYKDASFEVRPDQDRDYRLTLVAAHRTARSPESLAHPPPATPDKKPPAELKDVFSD
jgi:eukaryotic-like serine/threonine-protein kinase